MPHKDAEKTSTKRRADDGADDSQSAKKARKGFTVGPANLPDGTWKRKSARRGRARGGRSGGSRARPCCGIGAASRSTDAD
ncbi:hypothetical protein ANO11243_031430 [Dothideomycetidae sp. 11243]|nr:hypothetical protein ANO11243_031430 [fungal sp. No.11243]